MKTEHDYDLNKKIKIKFKGMDYFVMPRYRDHYLNHEYERFSLQILKNNLTDTSLFVDIGAHYGAYSLYAAHETGCQVIAIEPVTENFALLNENVAANILNNKIKTFDYAASDKNGKAEFNIPWASDSAGFYDHPNAETIRKQQVVTKKIDDVIDRQKADIIKIDTEGHEIGVLNGLKRTLKNNPDAQLIIEINPPLLENAGTSAEALLEMIRDFNKEIYMVDEDGFKLHRITHRLESWPRYINEGNYANLYCVPAQDGQYLMYVSHTAQLGGAELAMVDQICELRTRRILSHVVLPSSGPLEKILIDKGIGYTIIDGYSFWIRQEQADTHPEMIHDRNSNNINASIRIADLAAEIAPTMIVNNTMVTPWGCTAAQSLGVPLLWMIHEYGDLDHRLQFIHGIESVREFIVQNADMVACCSESVKKSLTGGSSAEGVHTVYNLLRIDRVVEKARADVPVPYSEDADLKLCIVGTFSEGKGQADAIDAVAALKKQYKKVELLLVGNAATPKYKTLLRKKVQSLGLKDAVKFVGFADNPYPYIAAADAVIVASRSEAFGRVTAEAMAIGVPVIAADKGGSLEMIENGKTGFLFKTSNTKDLARAINDRVKTPPKELEAMIREAKTRIARLLDVDANTDRLISLIHAAAATKAKSKNAILTGEWIDAVRSYQHRLSDLQARLEQAEHRAAGQEQINLAQAKTLTDITASKSYKLATKLSAIKGKIRPKR